MKKIGKITRFLLSIAVGFVYCFSTPAKNFQSLVTGILIFWVTYFLLDPDIPSNIRGRSIYCFIGAAVIMGFCFLGTLSETNKIYTLRHATTMIQYLMILLSGILFGGLVFERLFQRIQWFPGILLVLLVLQPLYMVFSADSVLSAEIFRRHSIITASLIYSGLLLLLFSAYVNRFVSNRNNSAKTHFVFIFLILLLSWFPYCIFHYPIHFMGGTENQIRQFMGVWTAAAKEYTHILYDGKFLSNHHPILLTLFYGSFIRIGQMLHSETLFAFLLSLSNLLISAISFSFALQRISCRIQMKYFILIFLICCFYPVFWIYAGAVCKDNLYADVLLVFYILIFELVIITEKHETKFRDWKSLCFVSFLIPFLKNQGAVVVFLSLLIISWSLMRTKHADRRVCGKLFLIGVLSVCFYYGFFCGILMPFFKISPGGRQEALSVPFQQTALFFKDHRNMVSDEEYKAVDKILPAEKIADLYIPRKSDPVKFSYKQDNTSADIINYLVRAWLPQFLKSPSTYFRAWALLTDGYYMFQNNDLIILTGKEYREFGVTAPWELHRLWKQEDNYVTKFLKSPAFSWIYRPALFFVILIITCMYCLYNKTNLYLLVLVPVLLNFLILIFFSPWNDTVRYALPVIYALPAETAVILYSYTKK